MAKKKVLCVIPARLGSTRLPLKMLKLIDGKPLIYYTWRQAKKAKLVDAVVVATDSKEIVDAVTKFGGTAFMSPKSIKCGSDRTAYVAARYKEFKPDIVINLQGDEPLIPPAAIDKTVDLLLKDSKLVMSTVSTPFTNDADRLSPNFVKVVTDKNGMALYFCRSLMPYPRIPFTKHIKHLGIYGYRADFLQKYVKMKQTPLEKIELLEQLRVLENGYGIKVGLGNYRQLEVNTEDEFDRVKAEIEGKK
jgi:3-deoxy-manno-octulosonate cytidylyltransferase (CMP-KDO synthetase)